MALDYFAFYWTLPMPWLGFTSLPDDVDAAARASRTIRYSRDLVRTHVKQQGGALVPGGEVARIETAPDRGSPELGQEFADLLRRAELAEAMVAVVDFSGHAGWRGHRYLAANYDHPRCDLICPDRDDVQYTGFDPWGHFEGWRKRTNEKIAMKPDHRDRILGALEEIDGTSHVARSAALNDLGLRTHGGKPWTADNLRKFLALDQG